VTLPNEYKPGGRFPSFSHFAEAGIATEEDEVRLVFFDHDVNAGEIVHAEKGEAGLKPASP
jgi:hypothetical protein